MNKEEKRDLITTVTICSFLFLGAIASTAYCFVQEQYLAVLLGITAMVLGFAQFIGGDVAYYRERFKEIKQEKEGKI